MCVSSGILTIPPERRHAGSLVTFLSLHYRSCAARLDVWPVSALCLRLGLVRGHCGADVRVPWVQVFGGTDVGKGTIAVTTNLTSRNELGLSFVMNCRPNPQFSESDEWWSMDFCERLCMCIGVRYAFCPSVEDPSRRKSSRRSIGKFYWQERPVHASH